MMWFVSYTPKASGTPRLVGPFENAEHARTFYHGLIYVDGQQHEGVMIIQSEKP